MLLKNVSICPQEMLRRQQKTQQCEQSLTMKIRNLHFKSTCLIC